MVTVTTPVHNRPDILLILYAAVHRCDTRHEQDQLGPTTESISVTSDQTSSPNTQHNSIQTTSTLILPTGSLGQSGKQLTGKNFYFILYFIFYFINLFVYSKNTMYNCFRS